MFSVVIPLFNKAPYLQRALDSVYGQTCPPDEIVVVNDGSTDGGAAIARAQRDPRVRVVDQSNQGVSAARNTGLANASQPFIAFLDADDQWLPGFLARAKRMIEACPGAVLYGTGFATVERGRELRRYGVRSAGLGQGGEGSPREGDARSAFGPVDFFSACSRGHVIHTSSMVVPKQAALAVGGFPAGVTHCEDHEFWAKLALAGTVVLSPEVLTRYHVDVPGQAVEYWNGAYKRRFDVLPYHRFLAAKRADILGGAAAASAQASAGFVEYCRKEMLKGMAQRLYWGDMLAAARFCKELRLDAGGYGAGVGICCWIALHPAAHPFVRMLALLARSLRALLKPRRALSEQR